MQGTGTWGEGLKSGNSDWPRKWEASTRVSEMSEPTGLVTKVEAAFHCNHSLKTQKTYNCIHHRRHRVDEKWKATTKFELEPGHVPQSLQTLAHTHFMLGPDGPGTSYVRSINLLPSTLRPVSDHKRGNLRKKDLLLLKEICFTVYALCSKFAC